MKKTKLFGLALLAAAWSVGGSAMAWDEPAQLDGVYQIGTGSELEWFAEYVNSATESMETAEKEARLLAQAVLTADIDMKDIAHQPIGVSSALKFNGIFDGQHHVISNLVINEPTKDQLGLFGWVRGGTTLKNIIMDASCSITGNNRVGSIVGCVQTNVANDPLEILNCVSFATLTSAHAAGMIGAGADQYPYFEMENCVNAGPITAQDKVSVFCGWNKSAGGNAKMYNCYNIGEIDGVFDGNNIFFRGANREVKNCYDFGNTKDKNGQNAEQMSMTWITEDPVHSGELCYYLNSNTTLSYNAGIVAFTQDLSDPTSIPMPVAGGKMVYQVADLNCDGSAKGSVSFSNTQGGTRDAHSYVDGFCSVCGDVDEAWITESEDGYYHFSTVRQIEWWSAMVNKKFHSCMNVKLDADIDFGGIENAHTPIGTSGHKWAAKFDGQGHHIKGMVITPDYVQESTYDGLGFFGSVRGGAEDAAWGKKNTEVEIKNLFIDADCSINHTSNYAAGIVGHVNSTFADAVITIENCGNEATVYTTGKNAAGILGCVESTNVGLKLYNLWNKGNITGKGGESAAICAWTGQRNVDGEVDVEGCWNIGEVTGVDGNGYNMIRRNTNIKPRNIVDLCITNAGNQGKVSVWNSENPISSGELCYLLNEDQSKIVYTQTLGEDEMPVYGTTSKQVYQAGTINCLGASVGSLNYNNESGETIQLGHNISDKIGMCDVCYTQFQAPELVEDYYQIKNAGHLEWFSAKVNEGGDANLQINGMLMNDIDMLGVENLHSPIGPSTASKYNGTFDGQGFRIKNMIIDTPEKDNVGLFGFLRGNAKDTKVCNLIIDKSCSIHGRNRVGGITGSCQNNGTTITLENIVNEAEIIAEGQDAAGIIGGQEGNAPRWYIHNVVNTGAVTAKHAEPYAGALCCFLGANGESKIVNFLNLGTINGHRGGNIGRIFGTNENIIDLSDTDFDSSLETNYGLETGLTKEDIATGKVAYTLGFKQLIGTDEYPSPLNEAIVDFVGESGYATLFDTTTGYELNGDVKAYVAVLHDTWLQLNEIEGVPASTPVVLKGSYYNKIAAELPAINVPNDLKGATEAIEADGTKYVLSTPEDKEVGFYQATVTIPAGEVYYQSEAGVDAFYFDAPTSINMVNGGRLMVDGPIYNLAGQRINKLQKGIHIMKGKKIAVN